MHSFAAAAPSNRSAVECGGPTAAARPHYRLIRLDRGFSRDEGGASSSPLRSVSDPEAAAERQQHLGSGTQSVAMIDKQQSYDEIRRSGAERSRLVSMRAGRVPDRRRNRRVAETQPADGP